MEMPRPEDVKERTPRVGERTKNKKVFTRDVAESNENLKSRERGIGKDKEVLIPRSSSLCSAH